MGKASEDGTSGLEIHAAGQVHIGLLPEGVQLVQLSVVGLDLAVRYSYTVVVQLRHKLVSILYLLYILRVTKYGSRKELMWLREAAK